MENSRGKNLAKNTIIIAIGKMCTQLLNFFLLPLYTYLLSKEEYGIVELLNTYVSLLLPVLTLQIEQGIFLFLAEAREKVERTKEIMSTSIFFMCVACMISGIAGIFLQDIFNSSYTVYLILNLIAIAWSNTLLQSARGLGDMAGYSVGSFLTGAVTVVLNIVFLVYMRQGSVGILKATFCGNIACILFLLIRIKIFRFFSIKKIRRAVLKEMLRYSFPLVPNTLAWWAISASDRTVVSWFLGIGYNGILSVAHKFASMYMIVYNVFNYSWTEAVVVNAADEQGKKFLQKTLNTAFDFFSSMCIGIIACIPFVFSLLVNSEYEYAYSFIPLFMLASLFNVLTSLYGALYIAKKMTKEIAVTTIIIGIINIALNAGLISYIGLWASAVSSVVAYGIIVIYRAVEIKKIFSIKIEKKRIFLSLCIYCLCYILYLRDQMETNIISFVIAGVYAWFVNKELLSEFIKQIEIRLVKRDGDK